MTAGELINILYQYPEDMQIWVSDRGYSEGGKSLTKVEKVSPYDSILDVDDINYNFHYTEDMTELTILNYLEQGYLISKDGQVLYKEIIYLNNI
jgi:hypothetical protein